MNTRHKHTAKDSRGRTILQWMPTLCAIFVILIIAGCNNSKQTYKKSRVLMDTYCTITVTSTSRTNAETAIDAGFNAIERIQNLINYYDDKSELSALNRAAGLAPVEVSAETLDMLQKAVAISKLTDGAFDPTIAPLLRHWQFTKGETKHVLPTKETISNSLRHIGYSGIQINTENSEVFLTETGMKIDLGGIAKGYGADKAIEAIKNTGVNAALVAIAGDIRGFGNNADGSPWRIGIQDPRPAKTMDKPWEDIIASIDLLDRAVSTSGDYQRFFIKDGKRYHHILDPRTGYPSDSGLISATVIAPEGYLSDSLSTAIFILGPEKGLMLLNSEGMDAVLIDQNKQVFITDGIKEKIKILKPEYNGSLNPQ
ncbi:MAG: FAD:protein FMN transferase [Nitrospira sp.]|nr:FAD:protein FMN transferase [bacterium]MBL7049431.1 FAD:protein FMN transferase [Nitrospira sp.]